jgi:hypothetical protein
MKASLNAVRSRVERLAGEPTACRAEHVLLKVSHLDWDEQGPQWPVNGAPTRCRCGALRTYRHILHVHERPPNGSRTPALGRGGYDVRGSALRAIRNPVERLEADVRGNNGLSLEELVAILDAGRLIASRGESPRGTYDEARARGHALRQMLREERGPRNG